MNNIKKKRKWNRVHYFKNKKKKENKYSHPVYVFGQSGDLRKFLEFTHTPPEDIKVEKLKHNIDPDDSSDCYVCVIHKVTHNNNLITSKKKYRIHNEDIDLINKLKNK